MVPMRFEFSSGERFFIFHQEAVRFGRAPAPENDFCLGFYDDKGDIADASRRISKNHFVIHCHDDGFSLESLSESTGTWTQDDQRITGRVTVKDGFTFNVASVLDLRSALFPFLSDDLPMLREAEGEMKKPAKAHPCRFRAMALRRLNNWENESYIFVSALAEVGSGADDPVRLSTSVIGPKRACLFVSGESCWLTKAAADTEIKIAGIHLEDNKAVKLMPGIVLSIDGRVTLSVLDMDGKGEATAPTIRSVCCRGDAWDRARCEADALRSAKDISGLFDRVAEGEFVTDYLDAILVLSRDEHVDLRRLPELEALRTSYDGEVRKKVEEIIQNYDQVKQKINRPEIEFEVRFKANLVEQTSNICKLELVNIGKSAAKRIEIELSHPDLTVVTPPLPVSLLLPEGKRKVDMEIVFSGAGFKLRPKVTMSFEDEWGSRNKIEQWIPTLEVARAGQEKPQQIFVSGDYFAGEGSVKMGDAVLSRGASIGGKKSGSGDESMKK